VVNRTGNLSFQIGPDSTDCYFLDPREVRIAFPLAKIRMNSRATALAQTEAA
jgi:hypothetical protein